MRGVNAVTWPSSPTPRWPAGWTSSSCVTRARPVSSGSARWKRATSWPRCEVLADAARRHRALFAVNDRADIARAAGADVLHLGQGDLPLQRGARDRRAGRADRPVHPRPGAGGRGCGRRRGRGRRLFLRRPLLAHPDQTRPRGAGPAAGTERAAEITADKPWFAIGGIDADRLPAVLEAGARRIVVVRAITAADDPRAAAAQLKSALAAAR